MLFNSIDFAIFFPIVFALYWFVFGRSRRSQNVLILVASLFFYAYWDWRFIAIILISITTDYVCGLWIEKSKTIQFKRSWLALSIALNLGLLCVFKYFNFFVDSFIEVFRMFGSNLEGPAIRVILPIGISFYTFQSLSYSIEVYRGRLKPTKNFLAFSSYVSFFPQLLAGPIEKARNLLPQFLSKREFDYSQAVSGMQQTLWGLFKKVVIADNCAYFVDHCFENPMGLNSPTLFLGILCFGFQIYCDFSGYSDMAVGMAKLFGIRLQQNFRSPYFSRSIIDFWRRWHVSLMEWLKDYVYIPLGGGRVSSIKVYRNILIVFLVSGLWHGANWTFVIWGFAHGIVFIMYKIIRKRRLQTESVAKTVLSIIITFLLVNILWVPFRSENLNEASTYFIQLFQFDFSGGLQFPRMTRFIVLWTLIPLMMAIDRFTDDADNPLGTFCNNWPLILRRSLYLIIALLILFVGGDASPFIYFQF